MSPAPNNPDPTSGPADRMQRQLDHDIKGMVSALIDRLSRLTHNPDQVQKQQPAGSSHEIDDNNHGVRIVTISGSNTGATMRGALGDNNPRAHGVQSLDHGEPLNQNDDEDDDGLGTYVNSNFQAINNCIMLDASYSANDPGVHLDISDFLEHPPHKGKSKHHRKEKEISRSDEQHSEPSSD